MSSECPHADATNTDVPTTVQPDGPPYAKDGVGWRPLSLGEVQAMLPHYEFIGMIGAGGMGAVYKARQTSLDRIVAVKILPPGIDDGSGANFAERFEREAKTLARLNHPGIIHVHDFGQAGGGRLYFVMEFVDGTDVGKLIGEKCRLPPERALAIAAQVCDALDYAHALGVIHRDIKPANVLIAAGDVVKVADFGLAKMTHVAQGMELTRPDMALGTPHFMAPEMLLASVSADARADLYAVGVMLYQMLTGEIPAGVFAPPSKKTGCDARFDRIVEKAMQADRDRRYQTAAEIRKDLDAIRTIPAVMDDSSRTPPSPFKAIVRLKPPTPDFAPRPAKYELLKTKVAKGGGISVGICGMGGAGKTELARKLADELKAGYPDALIEFDLKGAGDGPLTPQRVLENILRAFMPEATLPDTTDQLAGLLRQTLDGKRVLLLLDNAKDAHQIRDLAPPPAGCCVLVTSRKHFTMPGMESVDLGRMEPGEARAMATKICPRLSDAEADVLAKLCDCLPLALRLAASYLKVRDDKKTSDYLRELDAARQPAQPRVLTKLDRGRDFSGVESGLQASFELSCAQLSESHKRRFAQLSVFPDSFCADAARAVWAVDEETADEVLSTLRHFSLLEWLEKERRYDLHDLLTDFAASLLDGAVRTESEHRYAEHFTDTAARSNELYLEKGRMVEGLELFDRERRHIEHAFILLKNALAPLLERARSQDAGSPASDPTAAQIQTARQLIALVHGVTHIGFLRFHPRLQRIPWLEVQIEVARIIKDQTNESMALGSLGLAYAALGETHKAIGFYEQRLEIASQLGDRRGVGNALGNLGLAYAALGETRKAIGFHEQQLTIAREIGDRRGEGHALDNLGVAFKHVAELRKAIGYHEQSLAILREIGDRRGEGGALGNLGVVYAALGETRKAIDFYEQGLAIAREIGDRRGEAQTLGNLGVAHKNLGETRKAIAFYDQALTLMKEIGNRRGEGASISNLGVAYYHLGETRKAIGFYEQALVICREIGDRLGEGVALGNLGNAFSAQGEQRKAVGFFDQHGGIAREIGDRLGEGTALWNSATALDSLGERTEAIRRASEALRIFEEIEDPDATVVRAWLKKSGSHQAGLGERMNGQDKPKT